MVDPVTAAKSTDTEAWSSRVALAGRLPARDDAHPAERSQLAAMTAHRSLEAALRCLDGLPAEVDRERLASSVFAAMMCAYTVLDTPVRAPAHADGLREGQRLVAHAYETLSALSPREDGDRLAEHLMDAHTALRTGSEALARLAPAGSSVGAEFFLADTFVSDYSQG
jgi:hypothetical protein